VALVKCEADKEKYLQIFVVGRYAVIPKREVIAVLLPLAQAAVDMTRMIAVPVQGGNGGERRRLAPGGWFSRSEPFLPL
jgi:hypothetical protein